MVKTYVSRLLLGFTCYGLGVLAINLWFDPGERLGLLLLALPIAPLIWVVWVILKYVNTLDELQQRIVLESMAFAGMLSGFSAMAYLFVQDAGGPQFRPEWGYYLMWIYYALGLFLVKRKYG